MALVEHASVRSQALHVFRRAVGFFCLSIRRPARPAGCRPVCGLSNRLSASSVHGTGCWGLGTGGEDKGSGRGHTRHSGTCQLGVARWQELLVIFIVYMGCI
jgi:hypothetical protein